MKLDKVTRKRLYTGEEVSFPWPQAEAPPVLGRTYNIETEARSTGFRFTVIDRERLPSDEMRYRVKAKIDGDDVRLLDKRGGYTAFEGQALHNGPEPEPEAVDRETQERITREVHRDSVADVKALVQALEQTEADLAAAVAANPAAKIVQRELWQVRGRLEKAKARLRARAA